MRRDCRRWLVARRILEPFALWPFRLVLPSWPPLPSTQLSPSGDSRLNAWMHLISLQMHLLTQLLSSLTLSSAMNTKCGFSPEATLPFSEERLFAKPTKRPCDWVCKGEERQLEFHRRVLGLLQSRQDSLDTTLLRLRAWRLGSRGRGVRRRCGFDGALSRQAILLQANKRCTCSLPEQTFIWTCLCKQT